MPPTKNHAKNPKAGPLEDVLCWNCDQKLQHKALTDHHNRFKGDANHAGKKKAYYKPDVKKMTFFQASAKTEEKKKEAKFLTFGGGICLSKKVRAKMLMNRSSSCYSL